MKNWFMLTLVGKDRPGIVAKVSAALYRGGAHLGEASMTRLGGNFAVMLMTQYEGSTEALEKIVAPAAGDLSLRLHIDPIEGELHRHVEPNVRVSVYGADRAGIVAEVTGALAEAGLNILDLESDVGGSSQRPIYIMHIEGHAEGGADEVKRIMEALTKEKNIEVQVAPIDTLLG